MKSPLTGREMELCSEIRTGEFRRENLQYLHHFYFCLDTKEMFTNSELDALNQTHLHNAYRAEVGIPNTDEIIAVRAKYDVSAKAMSEILGLGTNSYRTYENGTVPAEAQGNLITVCRNPVFFRSLVEKNNDLGDAQKQRILTKLQPVIEKHNRSAMYQSLKSQMLNRGDESSAFTGFKRFSFDKITSVIQYYSTIEKTFQTKMNKLLFYSDFLHFKNHGHSITGARYSAIQRGPVPTCYRTIYGELDSEAKKVILVDFDFGDYWGSYFQTLCDQNWSDLFSVEEIETLNFVQKRFKGISTNEIIEISHEEDAWKENLESKSVINYLSAHSLRAIQ